MDEIVQAAMAKWPNVPHCYGWLRMDRRGRWFVPSGQLKHPAIRDFIGRNYEQTDGNWFFQNGPQRVFVALESAPWIWSVGRKGTQLFVEDQFGIRRSDDLASGLQRVLSDEQGALYFVFEGQFGIVDDRSMPLLGDRIEARDGAALALQISGHVWDVEPCVRDELPAMFGFVLSPQEPEASAENPERS